MKISKAIAVALSTTMLVSQFQGIEVHATKTKQDGAEQVYKADTGAEDTKTGKATGYFSDILLENAGESGGVGLCAWRFQLGYIGTETENFEQALETGGQTKDYVKTVYTYKYEKDTDGATGTVITPDLRSLALYGRYRTTVKTESGKQQFKYDTTTAKAGYIRSTDETNNIDILNRYNIAEDTLYADNLFDIFKDKSGKKTFGWDDCMYIPFGATNLKRTVQWKKISDKLKTFIGKDTDYFYHTDGTEGDPNAYFTMMDCYLSTLLSKAKNGRLSEHQLMALARVLRLSGIGNCSVSDTEDDNRKSAKQVNGKTLYFTERYADLIEAGEIDLMGELEKKSKKDSSFNISDFIVFEPIFEPVGTTVYTNSKKETQRVFLSFGDLESCDMTQVANYDTKKKDNTVIKNPTDGDGNYHYPDDPWGIATLFYTHSGDSEGTGRYYENVPRGYTEITTDNDTWNMRTKVANWDKLYDLDESIKEQADIEKNKYLSGKGFNDFAYNITGGFMYAPYDVYKWMEYDNMSISVNIYKIKSSDGTTVETIQEYVVSANDADGKKTGDTYYTKDKAKLGEALGKKYKGVENWYEGLLTSKSNIPDNMYVTGAVNRTLTIEGSKPGDGSIWEGDTGNGWLSTNEIKNIANKVSSLGGRRYDLPKLTVKDGKLTGVGGNEVITDVEGLKQVVRSHMLSDGSGTDVSEVRGAVEEAVYRNYSLDKDTDSFKHISGYLLKQGKKLMKDYSEPIQARLRIKAYMDKNAGGNFTVNLSQEGGAVATIPYTIYYGVQLDTAPRNVRYNISKVHLKEGDADKIDRGIVDYAVDTRLDQQIEPDVDWLYPEVSEETLNTNGMGNGTVYRIDIPHDKDDKSQIDIDGFKSFLQGRLSGTDVGDFAGLIDNRGTDEADTANIAKLNKTLKEFIPSNSALKAQIDGYSFSVYSSNDSVVNTYIYDSHGNLVNNSNITTWDNYKTAGCDIILVSADTLNLPVIARGGLYQNELNMVYPSLLCETSEDSTTVGRFSVAGSDGSVSTITYDNTKFRGGNNIFTRYGSFDSIPTINTLNGVYSGKESGTGKFMAHGDTYFAGHSGCTALIRSGNDTISKGTFADVVLNLPIGLYYNGKAGYNASDIFTEFEGQDGALNGQLFPTYRLYSGDTDKDEKLRTFLDFLGVGEGNKGVDNVDYSKVTINTDNTFAWKGTQGFSSVFGYTTKAKYIVTSDHKMYRPDNTIKSGSYSDGSNSEKVDTNKVLHHSATPVTLDAEASPNKHGRGGEVNRLIASGRLADLEGYATGRLSFFPEVRMKAVYVEEDDVKDNIETLQGHFNHTRNGQSCTDSYYYQRNRTSVNDSTYKNIFLYVMGNLKRALTPIAYNSLAITKFNTRKVGGNTESGINGDVFSEGVTTGKKSNKPVIYSGSDIHMSVDTSKLGVDLTGYYLDLVDSRIDGTKDFTYSSAGTGNSYKDVVASEADIKGTWNTGRRYNAQDKFTAFAKQLLGSMEVSVGMKYYENNREIGEKTKFKVQQGTSKVKSVNVAEKYNIVVQHGEVVKNSAYYGLCKDMADSYYGSRSNSELSDAEYKAFGERLFEKSALGKEIISAIEHDREMYHANGAMYNGGTRETWYDEVVRTFVVRKYTVKLALGDITVSDKLPIADKGTGNGEVTGKWNLHLKLGDTDKLGMKADYDFHVDGADFILSNGTTNDM